ncbi:hypothetical protein Efla_006011 [Eimeria flavescens]
MIGLSSNSRSRLRSSASPIFSMLPSSSHMPSKTPRTAACSRKQPLAPLARVAPRHTIPTRQQLDPPPRRRTRRRSPSRRLLHLFLHLQSLMHANYPAAYHRSSNPLSATHAASVCPPIQQHPNTQEPGSPLTAFVASVDFLEAAHEIAVSLAEHALLFESQGGKAYPLVGHNPRLTHVCGLACNTTVASSARVRFSSNPAFLQQLTQGRGTSALELLLNEFEDRFSDGTKPLPATNLLRARLDAGDKAPISSPPRRLSPAMREHVRNAVAKLEAQGVTELGTGCWSTPAVMVRKAPGAWRLCCDYREINKHVLIAQQPLPLTRYVQRLLPGGTR